MVQEMEKNMILWANELPIYNRGIIPLMTAVLCLDCEKISDGINSKCPVCGSGSTMPLSKILNRQERKEP